MHGKRFVLDTNIVIGILAGKTEIPELVRIDPGILISVITEIELLSFARLSDVDEKQIREFLSEAEIVYINHTIKNTTIELRRRFSIKTPDAIILATAIDRKVELVTDDALLLKCRGMPVISSGKFNRMLG
jgi:tRNA(fMet)-specific endonuclease VapC